jgi:hypothetical protein
LESIVAVKLEESLAKTKRGFCHIIADNSATSMHLAVATDRRNAGAAVVGEGVAARVVVGLPAGVEPPGPVVVGVAATVDPPGEVVVDPPGAVTAVVVAVADAVVEVWAICVLPTESVIELRVMVRTCVSVITLPI